MKQLFLITLITFALACTPSFDPKTLGEECKITKECKNNIIGVDCLSAADGPYFYINAKTGEELSVCGGACFSRDIKNREMCETQCPKKEWECKEIFSVR